MNEVRVRFAPSPTGYLHIGGLRTALYNYLYAKRHNGKFVLRIEDTDQTRFVEGAIENLINSLHWAGVTYDEGVFIKDHKLVECGDCGPYVQSKRLEIYRKYVDELIEKGYAYYCFCSKERLDNVRDEQKMKGQVPKYDGFCRSIPLDEAKKRVEAGEEYVVRLKLPKNLNIEFDDLVRGHIIINSDDIDDQVLLKSDGYPTYHMAVVVDDHLMGITHIVRGEEWLPSTPKHIYLYDAFGWQKPVYVHLPTVLNKDRKKLSKRQGDVSVDDFRAAGYLPEGLVNYLALVGWSPDSNEEILSMEEMVEQFSFEKVAKTGGIFDRDKLDWVNAHYIKQKSVEELTDLCIPYLKDAGFIDDQFIKDNREWLEVLVETLKDSMSTLKDIAPMSEFIFKDLPIEDEDALNILKEEQVPELMKSLCEVVDGFETISREDSKGFMKSVQKLSGIKGKQLFMPVRVIISGSQHGPELANIIYLLGKEKIKRRIENNSKYIK